MECILLRFPTYVIVDSLAEIVKIENTRIILRIIFGLSDGKTANLINLTNFSKARMSASLNSKKFG